MTTDLRDYQERAVSLAVDYYEADHAGSLLMTLPPAAGKTHIGARVVRTLAYQCGRRGLAIAHRREIVDGIFDKMVRDGIPAESIGVIMADEEGVDSRARPEAPIQIGMINTLLARGLRPPADLLWSDECHLDAADERGALVRGYQEGGAFLLGTTATPVRLDGRGFGDLYQRIEVVVHPDELVAAGHIADPMVWTVPPDLLPHLARRHRKGDFGEKEAAHAANRPTLIGSIVKHWKKRARGMPTLCFAVNVEHSLSIVRRFKEARVSAEHLDGSASPAERRAVLERLKSGRTKVVSSCMLLTAGVDLPAVRCVILGRPTLSLQLHIQMCGRVFRLLPTEDESLVRPVILDHAGNYTRRRADGTHVLGNPMARRLWTLDGAPEGDGGVAPMKDCPCGAVCATGCATCPECGEAFDMSREPVEDEAAELVRLEDARRAQIETEVRAAAKKHGWNDEAWLSRVIAARLGEAA